jgi:ATP-dependent DNA helicase RecG
LIPRAYEDRRHIKPIVKLRPAEFEVIKGEITDIDHQQTRNRFSLLKVYLSDRTATVQAIWFNQPYLEKLFCRGMKLIVSGKLEYSSYDGLLQVAVRDYEIDTGENLKIAPIYPLTQGLYSKKLRSVVQTALADFLRYVDDDKTKRAIRSLHLPDDPAEVAPARDHLAFRELFIFQLGILLRRRILKEESQGIAFKLERESVDRFIGTLPFKLTAAQERVIGEIFGDLESERPMNRLLQGDVGSGKTIVAALAAYVAIRNGYQAVALAPTEILAQQHFDKMSDFLSKEGIKIRLHTATTVKKSKSRDLYNDDLVVGTHALLEERVKFRNLGLVIIDEQHRFGVEQRARLAKKGRLPDTLVMTATPIPRSLALTLYGDLDRSLLDEMPPGRLPVKTYFIPENRRMDAYEFLRLKAKEGRQIFVICPLVEESEELDLKAAKEEAERLQREIFPELRVGLMHGRLKAGEKDKMMERLKDGEIDILVSTTVIEVGIDIPNATVMLVEQAERFGLAQLHQLRGRIGRGSEQSFCFLVGAPKSQEAKARMKAMIETNDGFKIAEADLKLRGPGEMLGLRQSGLPNFRVADIIRDDKIMLQARAEAADFLAKDPAGARNCWDSERYKVEDSPRESGSAAIN